MCGITGIFNQKRKDLNRRGFVEWCLKTMQHRGPDSEGIWEDERYITGFVRLSIRDLSSNGNQPMLSDCGKYCLTFNGEIYNVEKYRLNLISKGVYFKSTTDTEVLLYALIHYGIEKTLHELDGMFAFAFYNQAQNKLTVARDRVGIKPLYIGHTNSDIIFSSQYDHIIQYDTLKNNAINHSALGNYLQLSYVPAGCGIVESTYMLPHGHYATITSTSVDIKQYYFGAASSVENVCEERLFRESVQSQLVSDVPVGTFMSGGVDSPLISHWANEIKNIKSFTIGSTDKDIDETENVKTYANAFGIESFVQTITENDLLQTITQNSKAYSEPFGDFSSIPSLVVSKFAAQHVKVVLSGDGPDELFWGYHRNVKMLEYGPLYYKSKSQLLLHYVSSKLKGNKLPANYKRFFNSPTFSDFYFKSQFSFGGEWISKIYKPEINRPYFLEKIKEAYKEDDDIGTIMKNVRDIEMNFHLQRILLKVDRASMYNSIEVRVPYLSNRVLDYSNSLNYTSCVVDGIGKYNLKKILMKDVGADIVLKPKKGFLIPINSWLRNQIRKDVTEKILNMPSELKGLFDKKALELLLKKHMEDKMDYSGIIWSLYALVNWHTEHRLAK
jgi:asparagine synthase (glutamine-hydrolysing)